MLLAYEVHMLENYSLALQRYVKLDMTRRRRTI